MKKPKLQIFFDNVEIIQAYSREQAIADGVLVDVTPVAQEAGFKIPVAVTAAVQAQRDASRGQSFERRLWYITKILCALAGDTDIITFEIIVTESDKQQDVHLKAHIGPGDNRGPVVIIMFKHEDCQTVPTVLVGAI